MFAHLFERHESVILFVLFVLLLFLGYGELKIVKNVTAASTTWFFAIAIGSAFISEIFNDSVYGEVLSILFFALSFVALINYWRHSSARK